MVTCPWCGTSFPVFQSNCSRCGGPLHPPGEVEATGAAPLIPPPAPRAVLDSYALKLMSNDGWSISGLVFLLLGSIFAIVGLGLTLPIITALIGLPFLALGLILLAASAGILFWRYRESKKQVQVLKAGEAVLGKVINLQQNGHVRVNGRYPWNITYRFKVYGQEYTGQVATFNPPQDRLQVGKEVYVLYLSDNPALNSLFPHP